MFSMIFLGLTRRCRVRSDRTDLPHKNGSFEVLDLVLTLGLARKGRLAGLSERFSYAGLGTSKGSAWCPGT